MAVLGVKSSGNALGGSVDVSALAKALAPDPTKEMQLEVMRERMNQMRLYEENTRQTMEMNRQKLDLQRQATEAAVNAHNASAGVNVQKTGEAQTGLDARMAAAPAIVDAYKAHMPMPPMVLANAPELYDRREADINSYAARVKASLAAGGNADQIMKAGTSMTAEPLIVGGNPNQARLGMALKGDIPTQSTVLGPTDTAGADMSAREKLLTKDPTIRELNGGYVTMSPGQNGALTATPVQGAAPRAPGQYPTSSVEGVQQQFVLDYAEKKRQGAQTTPQEDLQYSVAMSKLYPGTRQEGSEAGRKFSQPVDNPNVPAGLPRAPTQGGRVDLGESLHNTPAATQQARGNWALMKEAEGTLGKMDALRPDTMNSLAAVLASNPTGEFTASQLLSQIPDPHERILAQKFLLWSEGRLRGVSGAAISAPEWAGDFTKFMPRAGATQEEVAAARHNRHAAMRAMLGNAYGDQPDISAREAQDLMGAGVDINESSFTPSAAPQPQAAPAPSGGKTWVIGPDGSVR